jgi:hypothetical protein
MDVLWRQLYLLILDKLKKCNLGGPDQILKLAYLINPCGGGVEYLHRDPASRKRRRNGAKKGRAIA